MTRPEPATKAPPLPPTDGKQEGHPTTEPSPYDRGLDLCVAVSKVDASADADLESSPPDGFLMPSSYSEKGKATPDPLTVEISGCRTLVGCGMAGVISGATGR